MIERVKFGKTCTHEFDINLSDFEVLIVQQSTSDLERRA